MFTATSFTRGILFFSSNHRDLAVETYYEGDEIVTAVGNRNTLKEKYRKMNKEDKLNSKVLKPTTLMLIQFVVILLLYFSSHSVSVLFASIFFCVTTFIYFYSIGDLYLSSLKDNSSAYRFRKIHAAEHKVLNAYTKLGRIPTSKEIKKFSSIHISCGFNSILNKIITFFVISLGIAFIDQIGFVKTILVCLGLIILTWLFSPLRILQKLVTAPPSYREVNLAIAGLSHLLELEKKE